ncbi:tyrosine-type recombinase/integrase [Gluconobacter cerinus]|uniref:tyrosine-type recombinase/integrase n=1 Tax=Gluconobacter cerinus TaxID=38307 RepID=UPI001B8BADBA|nr:tyrosine-type recombinase/integrase [Gluconobacter cerinus]MBS0982161.1 tyrosine-type recombinase/integrase [Gluconobacter cerinus]
MAPATDAKRPRISDDDRLVNMWLHNRSANTSRAYRADVDAFRQWTGKPLADVVLDDLQGWFDGLTGSDATRRRKLASVKSALAFGVRVGFLDVDVGAALRLERGRDRLSERILTEEDVKRIIEQEPCPRKRVALRVLYFMGLRISEMCALKWRDMTRRQQGGVASVFGKGNKTRHVLVPAKLWKEIVAVRANDWRPDTPVVPGHDGSPLHLRAAHRLVKRAAKRAGLPDASAHWFRHAHASHALDNGAPAHVVQQTLGHSDLKTTTRYAHVREGDGGGNYLKD